MHSKRRFTDQGGKTIRKRIASGRPAMKCRQGRKDIIEKMTRELGRKTLGVNIHFLVGGGGQKAGLTGSMKEEECRRPRKNNKPAPTAMENKRIRTLGVVKRNGEASETKQGWDRHKNRPARKKKTGP